MAIAADAARQSPSTPRTRPARATPSPPARPRVRSARRRARRARGSAATASRPARSAAAAAGLLLCVGAANGGGRDRAADDARDGDQRQDVRQNLEEGAVVRPGVDELEPRSNCARETEQEGGTEGAERPPATEDQGRERDEAA